MRHRSIRLHRWAVVLLLCLAFTAAAGTEKGLVTGQVTDSRNDIKLTGVVVTTADGESRAVTDDDGEFRLSLLAGRHDLTFRYIGFDPITETIEVTAGETTRLDVDFGQSGAMLEEGEMVVVGQTVGTVRALNRQKTSANLKNVVASDAIGRFPDQNAAEALDRLPGVSVARDQGEGRFVIVRGINPDLSTASVNGIPLAAADADARSVLLDVLPMNVMESLVVTKALTPDMPGDAIGGNVDIELPSAFDRSERAISGSAGANYSDLTGNWAESFQGTYSELFGADRQFGFLMSASWDTRDLGSDNVEADTWEQGDGGIWETEELEYREYDLTRERLGIVGNLEYRPFGGGKYYLRGLYGEYTDHEYRRRTVLGDMGLSVESPVSEASTVVQMKDRIETQKNMMLSAGGENDLDSWSLDYNAAYSYAEQDTPDDTEFGYEYDGTLEYTFEGLGGYTPQVTSASGDFGDLNAYEFDEVEDAEQIVEEKAWVLGANLRKDLDTESPVYLKSGFYASLKNKTSDLEEFANDDNPGDFDTLAGNTSDGRGTYADFPLIDEGLTDRFDANRDAFAMERDEINSAVEDYETDETIYAGYLMANAELGKLNLLAGARVEFTDLEATGYSVYNNEDTGTVEVESDTRTNDYTNVLPGIHARMDLTEDLVLHAAWTNAIARPNWEQTRNAQETTEEEGDIEVEAGNPELDPYEAMNLDAALSYYLPSVGLVSAGVFYKDIDSFIYAQTNDVDGVELTTWNNGESGHIYGVELAYQQKLSFLPGILSGLSIEGNLTISDSEADVPATDEIAARTTALAGHSDMVGSFALSFEKWDFFARLSGSYRSEYLDELGAEEFEDEIIDEHFQLDLSTAYTIQDRFTVFANVINITDEPLQAYWGQSSRLRQFEEYGLTVRAGVKFNL
ncbi:TonB-dependent receptor [bacterium]|nr:TonB-dependent receptor [bacterium]